MSGVQEPVMAPGLIENTRSPSYFRTSTYVALELAAAVFAADCEITSTTCSPACPWLANIFLTPASLGRIGFGVNRWRCRLRDVLGLVRRHDLERPEFCQLNHVADFCRLSIAHE